MHHLALLAAVLPLLVTSFGGCGVTNECVSGNAMTNPHVLGPPQAVLAGSRLRIGWDRGTGKGAELPRAYFAEGKVSEDRDVGPDGSPMQEAIEAVSDREIAVTVVNQPINFRGVLRFKIVLPDRKKFVTCERDDDLVDEYGLDVDLEYDSRGQLAKEKLTEIRNGKE